MNYRPLCLLLPPLSPRAALGKEALMVTSIILGSATLAAAGTAWWVKRNIYASPFSPVMLTSSEQTALDGGNWKP